MMQYVQGRLMLFRAGLEKDWGTLEKGVFGRGGKKLNGIQSGVGGQSPFGFPSAISEWRLKIGNQNVRPKLTKTAPISLVRNGINSIGWNLNSGAGPDYSGLIVCPSVGESIKSRESREKFSRRLGH